MEIISRASAISEVKAMLASLPAQVATIDFEKDKYECRIDIRPKSDIHCAFWLGFSTYGTYGLCFGHGLAFEDLSFNEFSPSDVATSILSGNVRETVWRVRGKVVKATGILTFQDGRMLTDKAVLTFCGALGLGRRADIVYEPYS